MKKIEDMDVNDLINHCMPNGPDGIFILDDSFMRPVFYDTIEEKEKSEKR